MEMDLKALRENELERIVEPRVELDDANRQGVRVEILKVISQTLEILSELSCL
jgi:hypothetical protein